jgi:protein-S-isoprenylcysteine O-methyltransferase Ste14
MRVRHFEIAVHDDTRDRAVGAVAVVVAATVTIAMLGRPTIGLIVAMVVSYLLWLRLPRIGGPGVVRLYISAIVVQVAHFAEEYRSGFQRAFPELFGDSWSDARFIAFNLAWLGLFVAAAFAMRRGVRLSYLAAMFLAVGGGIGNGLSHLALTTARGAYFPGTLTAPLSVIVGVLMIAKMFGGQGPNESRPVFPAGGQRPDARHAKWALFKTLIFTVVVPGSVAGFIPAWILSDSPSATLHLGVLRYLGAPVLVAGIAIYFACAWGFAVVGHGTPAPIDPPKRLVVNGLYRYVRNPMYVGVLWTILGQVLLSDSRPLSIYFVSVWAAFHLVVLTYEEPALRHKFGEDYSRYRAAVPRWLPRVRPWTPDEDVETT